MAHTEAESWSEQSARIEAQARTIDRDLGQAFFVWLADRPGADGRPIGTTGAIRIGEVQTPEDAEVLREYAAAFVAERFPAPAGPDPAETGGRVEYDAAREGYADLNVREIAGTTEGWRRDVRDRAGAAGAPGPGEVESAAIRERAATKADMTVSEAGREARTGIARERTREGAAAAGVEADKPLERHATESVPLIGGWLADKLFGTAGNAAPDGVEARPTDDPPIRDRGAAGGEAR